MKILVKREAIFALIDQKKLIVDLLDYKEDLRAGMKLTVASNNVSINVTLCGVGDRNGHPVLLLRSESEWEALKTLVFDLTDNDILTLSKD